MKSHVSRMLRSTAWAEREVCAAVKAAPEAHPEALPLLAHVVAAGHVWLARLQGQEPRHAVWPPLRLEECESLASENAAGFVALLAGITDEGLTKAVRYRNTKGEEFASAAIDILTQVVTHSAYHRGQIATALRRAGAQPASTDYITFARSIEP
jgi:uncharacterized damage-inducible protein DinB